MEKYILIFRQIDRDKFEALRRGQKKIETRAASIKYQKILPGDVLVFKCGQEKFEKIVKKVSVFKDVASLFSKYKWKDIMPLANSKAEAEAAYDSFPGYKEKIKKFGLVAFELK